MPCYHFSGGSIVKIKILIGAMPINEVCTTVYMSDGVRKGERIPRRSLPEFEEVANFGEAMSKHGFWGTALEDKNQYGPVAMMILLLVVATVTGTILKLLG